MSITCLSPVDISLVYHWLYHSYITGTGTMLIYIGTHVNTMNDDDIIKELNEEYKIIKRTVRAKGYSGFVSLPVVFEDFDVYVFMKVKSTANKGSSSKIILPKSLIGSEVSLIIPKNINYKTIHIDNN